MSSSATEYRLHPNVPNPFNPSTSLQFSLPTREAVTLAVYNVHGRLIRNLISNETYERGTYKIAWDGKNDAGVPVASGTYFARLQAGSYSSTQQMSLVK